MLSRYYPQTHQRSQPASYELMDARPRIKLARSLFPNITGLALDVGCGKGLLLAGLRNLGWKVYGTELSEVSSQYAQSQGITVYRSNVEDCGFTPGAFDLITMYHSLEHLTQPLHTLAYLHTLLRPGGRLVVEVPNIGSWYARVFGEAWFHFDVPRHLFHFSSATLRRLLETAGFEILSTQTHNTQYDAFGAVQSALNKVLRHKNLLNDFNTGETTLRELGNGPDAGRNLSALAISELALGLGFPLLASLSVALSAVAEGGTLRYIATRH